jgi:hypothetical protein
MEIKLEMPDPALLEGLVHAAFRGDRWDLQRVQIGSSDIVSQNQS